AAGALAAGGALWPGPNATEIVIKAATVRAQIAAMPLLKNRSPFSFVVDTGPSGREATTVAALVSSRGRLAWSGTSFNMLGYEKQQPVCHIVALSRLAIQRQRPRRSQTRDSHSSPNSASIDRV